MNRKVSLLFTVYEEVGHGGSFIPADTEEMISVDMGCVGDDLGCTERMVSICAKDSGGPYNYDLVTELSELAKANGLAYAIDVYPHYGSDVEATLRGGFDIRHGLIGPGVYASHNYERSHVDGVKNTFELLKAYLTNSSRTHVRLVRDSGQRKRHILLRITAHPRGALSQSEIVLPLRKTCYYSPLAEVGVFSTEINMLAGLC